MYAKIHTICTHPNRRSGVDKIERCLVFIDRRTYKLPFPIAYPEPTEAMLRNNCYGIETDLPAYGKTIANLLREIDWSQYARKGVRGEYNLNMRLVARALAACGVPPMLDCDLPTRAIC